MCFWRNLQSEVLKLRRTKICLIHIIFPLLGVIIFLGYNFMTSYTIETKLNLYFQALSVTLPMLIGIIVGMAVLQEEQAGHFQVMLSVVPSKRSVFLSKYFLLVGLGGLSMLLAIIPFAVGMTEVFSETTLHVSVYVEAFLSLFVSSLFMYMLHLIFALRFSRSASIFMGIGGSLVTALMLTGLGDGLWYVIPWAWSIRFLNMAVAVQGTLTGEQMNTLGSEVQMGMGVMGIMTVMIFLMGMLWFKHWEGANTNE